VKKTTRNYTETIVIQQPKAQRQRTKMSQAVELETILAGISIIHRTTATRFIDYQRAQGMAFKTLRNYAYALRSIDVIDKRYEEFTKEDLIFWTKHLEIDSGIKLSTVHVYKVYVKPFFKWLYDRDDSSEDYPAVVKWLKCKRPKPDDDRYIPSRTEIMQMIASADSQRDRAIMFVLLESGARAGEFVKIRIKDIVFDKYGALVRENGKTGERRIRLVESVPDLQLWLTMHPRRNDPDAPLWTTKFVSASTLNYSGLDQIIRKYCRATKISGIFGAHKFRHVQATEDAKHYPETTLRAKYGWTKDSDMPSLYVHQSARYTDGVILAHYGIKTGENAISMSPSPPKVCPRCKHQNSAMARFCMQCSAPLDAKAVMDFETRTAQADDITAQVLSELMKRAPDMLAQIIGEAGLKSKIESVAKG
jgi:integrase/recombinase XerD